MLGSGSLQRARAILKSTLPDWSFGVGLSDVAPVDWDDVIYDSGQSELTITRHPTEQPRFRLSFADIASFDVAFAARHVEFRSPRQIDLATIEHLVADQLVPRILSCLGQLTMHAGAVERNGSAGLFIGRSGAGKSTICARLVREGFKLIGDDAASICWIDDRPWCQSAYPSLRLFPDMAAREAPWGASLDDVAFYTDKRRVGCLSTQVSGRTRCRVRYLFIIDASEDGNVGFRELGGADLCTKLLENSFWIDPCGVEEARNRLDDCARLASALPGYLVQNPKTASALDEISQFVESKLSEAPVDLESVRVEHV